MGALVAFEATRLIIDERVRPPASLIVAANPGPERRWPYPPASAGTDEEVIAHVRRYEGMLIDVLADPELAAILMPTIRASLRAMETYVAPPRQPLPIPILAVAGEADPTVAVEEMDDWRMQTSESFRLATVPGGHFFIHQSGPQLLDLIRAQLQLVLAV